MFAFMGFIIVWRNLLILFCYLYDDFVAVNYLRLICGTNDCLICELYAKFAVLFKCSEWYGLLL